MNARNQLLVVLTALMLVCSSGAMVVAATSGSGSTVDQSSEVSQDDGLTANETTNETTDVEQNATETDLQNESENESQGAYVTFNDQTTEGETVVVEEVTLASGGFVTIHNSSLLVGNVIGSVLGTSEYLEAGTHQNVTVELNQTLEADETLIAMAHRDTNDNQSYDFVETQGQADGPYLTPDNEPVTDQAVVTVAQEQPTEDNVTEDNVTEQPVEEEPFGDNVTEEPTEDNVTEEPFGDNVTEDNVTEEPFGDNVTEDNDTEEPFGDNVTEEPTEDNVTEQPVEEEPFEDNVTEEPTEDNITEDNVSDDAPDVPGEEEPTEDNVTEQPTEDEDEEENITVEQPMDEMPIDAEDRPIFVVVQNTTIENVNINNASVHVLVVVQNVSGDQVQDQIGNITEEEPADNGTVDENITVGDNVTEDNVTEEPVEDEPFEDNVTEDNVTEDNVTEDNVTEDTFTEDNATEDTFTEDNDTEDTFTEDNDTEDNVTEEPVDEEPVEDNVTEDNFTEDNLTEDNVTEDTFTEDNDTGAVAAQSFNVTNLEAPDSAAVGENVAVTATIENPTDEERTETVQFRLDGDLLAQTELTLESGASEEVTFEVDTSGLQAGTYVHIVLTEQSGEVAMVELTEQTQTDVGFGNETENTTNETDDGFGNDTDSGFGNDTAGRLA